MFLFIAFQKDYKTVITGINPAVNYIVYDQKTTQSLIFLVIIRKKPDQKH